MEYKNKKTGFTLIELSIVLVIISLIVGGVIGGKALIRSAELQSILTDVNGFKTAINTFQLQYDALPGDMRDANDYWSSANNGDGGNTWSSITEMLGAWHHLSLAQIVDGTYSGTIPDGVLVAGFNTPASSIDTGAFEVWYDTDVFPGGDTNFIRLGGFRNAAYYHGGIVKAQEAKTLDKKADDGRASSGKIVIGFGYDLGGAPISGCVSGGDYVLSSDVEACQLRFFLE